MEQRLRPFRCYFCNKTIENDTELGHTSVCAQVLIPCPNKCGSYVPRMEMKFHQKECLNKMSRSMTRLPTVADNTLAASTSSLDRKMYNSGLGNSSSDVNKELFYPLQNEIQKLSSRLNNIEIRSSNLSSSTPNLQIQQKQDFEKIKYQFQLLLEWKKAVDFRLETLKQSINTFEKSEKNTQIHWMNFQQKIITLDQLQMDVNRFREGLLQEQEYNRKADMEFAKKIDEFHSMFENENASIAGLWNDQKLILADVQKEIGHVKAVIDEQKAKNSTLIFDVRSVAQTASETQERFEIQEREFGKVKRDVEQLKLDMEILDGLAGENNTFGAPSSSPGRIIWKISNFQTKMAKAKESETVVKSSIFYTHDFGYKIRGLVYLNGLNKWKDRYALISLHVLKGDYDPLLKWPCHIEGTVILRDTENLEQPKHFSKYISAKREEGDEENEDPQESSSSYIFIPHSTLIKSKFLKNDTIFLEIIIEQNKKLTETTI